MAFTTFDMSHFDFDVQTGELIGKDIDDIFANGAIFVYGSVRSLGQHRYEIVVECAVRGSIKKGARINFQSDKFGWGDGSFDEALVLQNGHLIDRKGIIFKNCN